MKILSNKAVKLVRTFSAMPEYQLHKFFRHIVRGMCNFHQPEVSMRKSEGHKKYHSKASNFKMPSTDLFTFCGPLLSRFYLKFKCMYLVSEHNVLKSI